VCDDPTPVARSYRPTHNGLAFVPLDEYLDPGRKWFAC
jgi:hypothetical protein